MNLTTICECYFLGILASGFEIRKEKLASISRLVCRDEFWSRTSHFETAKDRGLSVISSNINECDEIYGVFRKALDLRG